jgi:hypothetical protein
MLRDVGTNEHDKLRQAGEGAFFAPIAAVVLILDSRTSMCYQRFLTILLKYYIIASIKYQQIVFRAPLVLID